MTHFRETAPELWLRAFRVLRSKADADRFCERLDAEWGFLRRKREADRIWEAIESRIRCPIRTDPSPDEWARSPQLRDAAVSLLRLRQTLTGQRPGLESGTWDRLSRSEQSRAAKDLRRYLIPFVEAPRVRIARRREVISWVQMVVLELTGGAMLLSFSDSGDGMRSRGHDRDARLTSGVQLILAVFADLGLPVSGMTRAVARDLKSDRQWIRQAQKCVVKQRRDKGGAVADLLRGLSKRTRAVTPGAFRDVLSYFPDAPPDLRALARAKLPRLVAELTNDGEFVNVRPTRERDVSPFDTPAQEGGVRRTEVALFARRTAVHYVETLDEPCRTGRLLSDGLEPGQTKRFAHFEYQLSPDAATDDLTKTMRETVRAYNSLGSPETWHFVEQCPRAVLLRCRGSMEMTARASYLSASPGNFSDGAASATGPRA